MKPEIGYKVEGPQVWRVSYGFQFEQFETVDKALDYMKKNLISKGKHMLLLQRVNLKEVKIENERRRTY